MGTDSVVDRTGRVVTVRAQSAYVPEPGGGRVETWYRVEARMAGDPAKLGYWVVPPEAHAGADVTADWLADYIDSTPPNAVMDRGGVTVAAETQEGPNLYGLMVEIDRLHDYVEMVDRYFMEAGWGSFALLEARRGIADLVERRERDRLARPRGSIGSPNPGG